MNTTIEHLRDVLRQLVSDQTVNAPWIDNDSMAYCVYCEGDVHLGPKYYSEGDIHDVTVDHKLTCPILIGRRLLNGVTEGGADHA